MTMEAVIHSLALLMIERHGAEASYVAAERVRVLAGCNDRQISKTWHLISRRIDEIAPPMPKGDIFSWPEPIDRVQFMSLGIDRDEESEVDSAEDPELVS